MNASLIKYFLLIIIICGSLKGFSASVSGKITNKKGESLPFTSVYVKNTTVGVSSNAAGKYFLELKPGKYILIYSYVGFKKIEKEISLSEKQNLIINIVLKPGISQLTEVEVVSDKFDRGKFIMSKVRENRKKYTKSIQNYECELYSKTSIEKEYIKTVNDSTITTGDSTSEKNDGNLNITIGDNSSSGLNSYLKKERLNLIEHLSQVYYKSPNKYKENILVYHDYSENKRRSYGNSVTLGFEGDFNGREDIIPIQQHDKNIYIYKTLDLVNSFNFYRNYLDLPRLCKQAVQSPIGVGAQLNYKYEYLQSFYENDKKIYKIRVIPRNNIDALFSGVVFIEDSTFVLIAADLSINEKSLVMHENFNIIVNYKLIKDNIYLPEKINIIYTIKHGKQDILGEIRNTYGKYKVNYNIDEDIFSSEIRTYAPTAFDNDSLFWSENRPVQLKPEEIKFIKASDSLAAYYTSKEYLDKQDSLFSRLTWWAPLTGYGRKNHYKGTEWHIGGIFEQIVPFGVGGYRHRLPLYFNKEFKNDMLLETKEFIDYGFKNNDVKGRFGLGLTYYPKKFIRTFVTIGNTYDRINDYASVEQTFSRSNFVNTKSLEIKQRAEVINGLFAELTLFYTQQDPITDLELSKWSEFVFGDLNTPGDFQRYIHAEIRLDIRYAVGQKYIIKGNKKIIIGKNYPKIFFTYRKGLPGVFNSDTDFDYLEMGSKADIGLARLGTLRWEASLGIFPNTRNLRVLENKFFRGSDVFIFSDPLRSFQLLGPTLKTNSKFLKANFIHHFDGFILNKVPYVRRLKLSIAGGAGVLSIPDEDFNHFEMFAGLERSFRFKKQIFRIGLYGVTADNSLSDAKIILKIGMSFFNSYTGKYGY